MDEEPNRYFCITTYKQLIESGKEPRECGKCKEPFSGNDRIYISNIELRGIEKGALYHERCFDEILISKNPDAL